MTRSGGEQTLQGMANLAGMMNPMFQIAQNQQALMTQLLQTMAERGAQDRTEGGVTKLDTCGTKPMPIGGETRKHVEWTAKLLAFLWKTVDKRIDIWGEAQKEEVTDDAVELSLGTSVGMGKCYHQYPTRSSRCDCL